jgi:predicted small lipoprotein YifL
MSDASDDTKTPRRASSRRARKLLVATLGLATLSLTGCGGVTSGNLVVPPTDAGTDAPTAASDDAGTSSDDSGAR